MDLRLMEPFGRPLGMPDWPGWKGFAPCGITPFGRSLTVCFCYY